MEESMNKRQPPIGSRFWCFHTESMNDPISSTKEQKEASENGDVGEIEKNFCFSSARKDGRNWTEDQKNNSTSESHAFSQRHRLLLTDVALAINLIGKVNFTMTPDDFGLANKVAATGLVRATSLPSRAYVTFLAGNIDYVVGIVGLAKGLRKVKSAYPLVVAVLPDVPVEHHHILINQGCIVREIEPVYPPENQTQFAMAYYVINYSKFRIWEFMEYSKMIYLDGDIQVFENIDHLFDMPDGYFYVVMDCFYEKTWSHNLQYNIRHYQQCPDKVQWPEEKLGTKPSLYFNTVMFVFEPSLTTYNDLLKTLRVTPSTSFAEQVTLSNSSGYLHCICDHRSHRCMCRSRYYANQCAFYLEGLHPFEIKGTTILIQSTYQIEGDSSTCLYSWHGTDTHPAGLHIGGQSV
ncbi:Galactinol synthase 2 [Capsicum baccatum]|uniref:Hexosyltransferase n=1 Tax=Capsicum baccatum TaxID=33114 RepID=A0A2G2X9G6_CAPBA|nr:Galactinol synthase 2 [Capsicum baccatum]